MTEEKEILTILSKNEYDNINKYLRSQFGEPKSQRRISLQSDDYSQADIDTRIRITNGEAELIQKVGDWKRLTKGEARTEIMIPLPNNAQAISDLYLMIRNLRQGENIENIIMQFESYIWKNDDFEIKLTHQFGKNDAYNCEVEVFNDSLNPKDLVKKYHIPIHLPTQTQDFWRKWNRKVNIFAEEISEKEILNIIGKYL